MTARSSSAYFVSALLHGAVVALILFIGYLANQSLPDGPKVFELVAGAGENFGATEAPALGTPGGIKIDVPEAPAPEVPAPAALTPAPVEPVAPEPVEPTPVAPAPVAQDEAPPVAPAPAPKHALTKAKPKPKSDAIPNFAKSLQRTENRRAARLMAKYKKQLEAEERRQQLSYEQYLREHGSGRPSEGIAQGVAGGSRANKEGGAGGKALTREQGELLDAYFALLRARIKENHVPPPDVNDQLSVMVGFYLAADGTLSRVHVIRSSGSSDFDQSVLEAFARTHSIGPPRGGRGDSAKLEFKMRDEDE